MITRKVKLFAWTGLLGATGGLALLFFFAPDQYPFYPRCLIHSLTGLQCPGCGGLRAMHRLLHGDIHGAFQFNPLLVSVLPLAIAFGLSYPVKRITGYDYWQKIRHPLWTWILLATLFAFTVARNLRLS